MKLGKSLGTHSIIGYSILFGGGIGNFYDRIVNNGAVIDFLNVGIGSIRTGIFNVADMAIILGLGILLFEQFAVRSK